MRQAKPKIEAYPDLRTRIRREMLQGIAAGFARDAHTENVLAFSKSLAGYENAFHIWAAAMWRWADSQVTPEMENAWRTKLFAQRKAFSPVRDYAVPASDEDLERYLQQYLVRRATFLVGLSHKKETDPNWFKAHAFYFYVAQQLDDDALFKELARLTTRKTSQANIKGRQSLDFWLLWLWIPDCFWAITKAGIQGRLCRQHSNLLYHERTISTAISRLKLGPSRPRKPHFWGFDHEGQMVPLRSAPKDLEAHASHYGFKIGQSLRRG